MITELDRQLQLEYALREAKENTVKALLKAGVEPDKIVEALDLPLEKVESLREA